MSVIYQAEIGDDQINITREDLEALDIESIAPGQFHVLRETKGHQVTVLSADHRRKEYKLAIGDQEITVTLKDEVEIQVHAMGLDEVATSQSSDIVAPMPGLVLEINVKDGESISAGKQLIILEAMKMENVLSAPGEGVIETVHVKKGQPVDKGQILISFE